MSNHTIISFECRMHAIISHGITDNLFAQQENLGLKSAVYDQKWVMMTGARYIFFSQKI